MEFFVFTFILLLLLFMLAAGFALHGMFIYYIRQRTEWIPTPPKRATKEEIDEFSQRADDMLVHNVNEER